MSFFVYKFYFCYSESLKNKKFEEEKFFRKEFPNLEITKK